MKPREVQKILGISRSTLNRYIKKGYLKRSKLSNGHYDYDDDSVYELKNEKKSKYKEKIGYFIKSETNEDFNKENEKLLKDKKLKYIVYEYENSDFEKLAEILNHVLKQNIETIYMPLNCLKLLSNDTITLINSILNTFDTDLEILK